MNGLSKVVGVQKGDMSKSMLRPAGPAPKRQTSPLRKRAVQQNTDFATADELIPHTAVQTLGQLTPADPSLRCLPSVVHFAAFVPGQTHTAVLRLVNVSKVAQRLIVAPIAADVDDGSFFSMRTEHAGRIAPGMAQTVALDFRPTEPRYYYATLRVVGERGELHVPLHAYPVPSTLSFPSRVDFGRCALGEPVTRLLPLQPGVPIPFEFTLTPTQPHPDIVVQPGQGLIEAGGRCDVSVTYTPTRLTTAVAEYELRTSLVGTQAQRVVVAGSAAVGLTRDKRLLQALADSERLTAATPLPVSSRHLPVPQAAGAGSTTTTTTSAQQAQEAALQALDGAEEVLAGETEDELVSTENGTQEVLEGGRGEREGRERAIRSAGARGTGQRRWLKLDPGLAVLDDRLESFKEAAEDALLHALEERGRVVDAMAASLRLATGVRVTRQQAIGAVQGVLKAMGKEGAPVDDYGRVPSAGAARGGRSTLISKPGPGTDLASLVALAEYRQAVEGGVRLPPALPYGAQKEYDYVLAQRGRGGWLPPRHVRAAVAEARQARAAASAAHARLQAMAEQVAQGGLEGELEHKSSGGEARVAGHDSTDVPVSGGRQAAVLRGPALSAAALAATEVAASWAFPALQGVPAPDLLPLLVTLVTTPDHAPLTSGTLMDEVLGEARAQVLDSTAALQVPRLAAVGDGLPPALAALVRAAASPMSQPRVLRAQAFREEMAALAAAQAGREVAAYPWAGEELMTEGQVEQVRKLRALLRALEDVVSRRLHRSRRTTVAVPAGGLRAVREQLKDASRAAAAVEEAGPGTGQVVVDMRTSLAATTAVRSGAAGRAAAFSSAGVDPSAHYPILSSPVVRAALLPLSCPVVPAGARAAAAPTFREAVRGDGGEASGDPWAVRRDAVARVRGALSTAVVRARVERRLAALERTVEKAVGGGKGGLHRQDVGSARAVLAGLVEAEQRRAGLEERESWVLSFPPPVDPAASPAARAQQEADLAAGPRLLLNIAPGRITRAVLPVTPPDEGAGVGRPEVRGWDLRVPLVATLPVHACEEAPFTLPEWPEEHVMGYTPFQLPVAPLYQPQESDRPLREGALHETAATAFLPLPSGQAHLDGRLQQALLSARTVQVPAHGLGATCEPGVRTGWDCGLMESSPLVRALPPALSAAHPATGQWGSPTGVPREGELGHGLAAAQWLRSPYVSNAVDAPPTLLGHRHPYSSGHGLGSAAPLLPGCPPGMVPPPLQGAQGVKAAAALGGIEGEEMEGDDASSHGGTGGGGEGKDSSPFAVDGPRGSVLVGQAIGAAGATWTGNPLDINGCLPSQGEVLGAVTGLSSLRHATAAPVFAPALPAARGRVSAARALPTPTRTQGAHAEGRDVPLPPARQSDRYMGSVTRPPLDMATPLLVEGVAARLKADGAPRLPTDVTPLEARPYVAALPPPSTDPWLPTSLPPLLAGPRAEDALSDDSESDPEADEAEGRRSRRGPAPPTLAQARGLFAPKGKRQGREHAPTPGSTQGSTGRLRLEGVEPAGAHVLAVATQGAGGGVGGGQGVVPVRPFTLARDKALLQGTAYDLAAAWSSTHWLEGVLVGPPLSDAGEAALHPGRLGVGSGPGLQGAHAHGQGQQGGHVRAPRGAGLHTYTPDSITAGIVDDRRSFVMRPR